jgi:DNA-binding response OmpR family regulator
MCSVEHIWPTSILVNLEIPQEALPAGVFNSSSDLVQKWANFGAIFWLSIHLESVGIDPVRSTPRILLADDRVDARQYVQRLLTASYEVESVGDGEAALAATRENPPDLVLTGVRMPRLDGFGLLRALRNDPRTRSIPVIMLSARAGDEAQVEGLEAGADHYLVKPFSARELLARVQNLVLVKRARDALQRELATHNEDSVQAMKAGAVEFLTKPFRSEDLLDAIQLAIARDRETRKTRAELAGLRARYELLTAREREVMACVVSGMLNK